MTLMPRARPRSWGGKTAVTIAAEVATSSAAPAPCTARLAMSQVTFMLSAEKSEPTVKIDDAGQVVVHAARAGRPGAPAG